MASCRSRRARRMITPCRGRPSRRRMATSSSRRGRKISGASFATCWSSPSWPTIRALPTNAERVKNRAALVPRSRSDLPHPHRRPIGSTRLRAAEVPAAPVNNLDARFCRAAGRGTRDDRRIRSSRGRQGAAAGQSDQDVGTWQALFPSRRRCSASTPMPF